MKQWLNSPGLVLCLLGSIAATGCRQNSETPSGQIPTISQIDGKPHPPPPIRQRSSYELLEADAQALIESAKLTVRGPAHYDPLISQQGLACLVDKGFLAQRQGLTGRRYEPTSSGRAFISGPIETGAYAGEGTMHLILEVAPSEHLQNVRVTRIWESGDQVAFGGAKQNITFTASVPSAQPPEAIAGCVNVPAQIPISKTAQVENKDGRWQIVSVE